MATKVRRINPLENTLDTTNSLINQLNNLITRLEQQKEDYYADGNSTDSHMMWLVGQIDGIQLAIKAIKGA